MKKKLQHLFFFFLLGTIGANAQPVINATDFNPVIGDNFNVQHVLTSSSTDPGAGGANVVWDYTQIVDSGNVVSVSAMSPAGTPGVANFPNSNVVLYNPSTSNYAYDLTSSATLGQVGQYNQGTWTGFSPQLTQAAYPIQYNQVNTDNFSFVDPAITLPNGTVLTGYDTITVDGYGTLKLPNHTYTNVLREKIDVTIVASIFGVSLQSISESFYVYCEAGIHYPLLELTSTTATSGSWVADYYAGNPLPLQITSFNVSWQNKTPYLQWSAVNTQNTKSFNVQRSMDGNSFITVGQVAVSSGSSYHFEDNNAPKSTMYYRLQQVDKNGQTFYSSTARLTVNSQPLTVYPNPAKGAVHLSLPIDAQVELMVYDVAGKLVYQNKTFSATNTITTDTWSKGTYMVRIKDSTGWKVSSFEKE